MRPYAPQGRHRTLSVMPTYRCTAHCKHCGTYSHPGDGHFLDEGLMLRAIEQAAEAGYEVIVFTGGEATLAWSTLIKGVERATALGIGARLVTNAWWATDEAEADRTITELVAAGLVEINYSTGDQHTRFVPLDNVMRAVRAAAKIPMKTIVVMLETVSARALTREDLTGHAIWQETLADFPRARPRITESPWMPLAPRKLETYPDGMVTTAENLPLRTGCSSCLGTTTVQADGRIGACCGLGMRSIPELQVGNVADTSIEEADRRASDDFLKRWIRVEGPEKILAWAARHDPSIEWEGMYAHRCQACMRLYKDLAVRAVIRDRHEEKIADVLFGEWVLEHYDPEPVERPSGPPAGPRP